MTDGVQQKMQWGMKTLAVIAVIFLGTGFFIGVETKAVMPWQKQGADVPAGPHDANLAPLFKAWELLDKNFVASATSTKALTAEQKIWGAVSGLAAAYGDPYTEFLPPQEKKIFDSQVQGNFGGVGMEIGTKEGQLVVIAPLKDTPAFRAGIKSGDLILEIDGESTASLSVSEAVEKIRGPEGTRVSLKLARNGEPSFPVTLTREQISMPTVDYRLRDDGVFVIQLYSFNSMAPEKFRGALGAFADSNADKMIIDLRGDPGGYLEAAVDIASWFLPVGAPVVIQDSSGKEPEEVYRSRGYDVFTDKLKLAILIDGGSASASEILAGALHDHGKATLIGEKSFGKGSVQQLFDVTPDSSLKITIARWLTPNRISISHEGLIPNIVVERTKEDVEAGKDPQLERAAEFLKTGK